MGVNAEVLRKDIDLFLESVRRELLFAWSEGQRPVACILFGVGGRQIGNMIW
jgi:hypothetical protein